MAVWLTWKSDGLVVPKGMSCEVTPTRNSMSKEKIDIMVLAQLSMAVFAFSHPDPVADFGVKVLNSAETGFCRAGEILRQR